MGGSNSIHVYNGSSVGIRAKVAQDEIRQISDETTHKFDASAGGKLEMKQKEKEEKSTSSTASAAESVGAAVGNAVAAATGAGLLNNIAPSGNVEGKISYNFEAKKKFEGLFNEVGFASIEPQTALEFDLYSGSSKKVYVSVWIEDERSTIGYRNLCHNATPKKNTSLFVTNNGVQNSYQKPPKKVFVYKTDSHSFNNDDDDDDDEVAVEIPCWENEDGLYYSADLVKKVYRQEDVDKEAERYRRQKERGGEYSTDSAWDREEDQRNQQKEITLVKLKDSRRDIPGLRVRPVQDCLYAMDGGAVRKVRALNMQRDSAGHSSEADIEFGMKRTRISNNEMEIVISVKKQSK